MAKHQSFTTWLKTHRKDDTAIGDLARDVAADPDWPSRRGFPGSAPTWMTGEPSQGPSPPWNAPGRRTALTRLPRTPAPEQQAAGAAQGSRNRC